MASVRNVEEFRSLMCKRDRAVVSLHSRRDARANQALLFGPGCAEVNAAPPIFFRLALHRRGRRVLHLELVWRAAGAVAGAEPLRYDALEIHLAGMPEHDVAGLGNMLVEL